MLCVRLFDLCLFGFVGFLFLLGSRKNCGLWLWHPLDFSLTFFLNPWWFILLTVLRRGDPGVSLTLCCFVVYSTRRFVFPGVSLTLCCFMVYSTRRFVLSLAWCHFVLVFFSVLWALQLPHLGKRGLLLVLFVRLFDLRLFGFVSFFFLLMSGNVCDLWLWHSRDFLFTFFFSYAKMPV